MRLVITLLATVAVVIIWEYLSGVSSLTRILVSSPSALFAFVSANYKGLAYDFAHTCMIAVFGLAISIIVSLTLGTLGVAVPRFGKRLELFSTVAQSVPLVVFAPFAIIAFGVGVISKVALAFLISVFPLIVGVISSARSAETEFRELVKFYRVDRLRVVWEVYFPFMLPSLVASIRIAASLAILGAVIAEFTGSQAGLGRNIYLGTVRLDAELMMSSLILTCALGIFVHFVMSALEKRVSWWRV